MQSFELQNYKMRKKKVKKNKNLHAFFMYTLSILGISLLLIGLLTIKNECSRLKNQIIELKKSKIKNTGIVKELQSQKEYFSSEQYISSFVKNTMVAVVPEPEIIIISNE